MCLDPYKNWIQVDPVFEFLKLLLCCDVALSSPIEGLWETKVLGMWRRKGLQFPDYEDRKYMKKFRVNKTTFYQLYDIVGHRLGKQSTRMREAIPGHKRMAVFLHWMAHGNTMEDLADTYSLGTSTVHGMIHDGLALFESIVSDAIVFPTGRELEQVLTILEACTFGRDAAELWTELLCPSTNPYSMEMHTSVTRTTQP